MRIPTRISSAPMPFSGGAQVALDVVGEGLQRAHVHDPDAIPRGGVARQPGGRAPTGTPQASCRSPWERIRARARRGRSPATPAPVRGWDRRRRSRTSGGWRGRSTRAPSPVQAIHYPPAAAHRTSVASLWAPECPRVRLLIALCHLRPGARPPAEAPPRPSRFRGHPAQSGPADRRPAEQRPGLEPRKDLQGPTSRARS